MLKKTKMIIFRLFCVVYLGKRYEKKKEHVDIKYLHDFIKVKKTCFEKMFLSLSIVIGWFSLIIAVYYIIRPIRHKWIRIILILIFCICLTNVSCRNLPLYDAFSILTIAVCWLTSIRLVHLGGLTVKSSLSIESYLFEILWIYFPIIPKRSSKSQWSIGYDLLILVIKMLINHSIYRWLVKCGTRVSGEMIFLFFISMITISYVLDAEMIFIRLISRDRYTLESFTHFPLLSLSLREFWGERYNRIVNRIYKESIFIPMKDEYSSRTIGGLTTFIVSGFLHAHIAYIVFDDFSLSYSAWKYFLYHGIVCLLEAKMKNEYCEHVSWLLTMSFLIVTAPLILRPFLDEKSLFFKVNPPPLLEWIPQLPIPETCP